MHRAVVTLSALAFAATAIAAPNWTGAGWYQLWDDGLTEGLHAGPFDGESACKAALPKATDDIVYYCEYLTGAPPD